MEKKKERIAKRIASAGVCSRRDAERAIEQGRVKVDGVVLKTPAFLVDESNMVEVDGVIIGNKPPVRVWCYHKPAGLITTAKDPKGRPTVFENLPHYLPRVVSIGRLDFNSEGLLLLTTDGALARQLELPTNGWKRKYRVRVHGKVSAEVIGRLRKGVKINGVSYAGCEVEIERVQGTNTWVLMTLTEGKNREIRRLMDFFGLPVTRLIRISYGPFNLGNLEKGEVREIPTKTLKEFVSCV